MVHRTPTHRGGARTANGRHPVTTPYRLPSENLKIQTRHRNILAIRGAAVLISEQLTSKIADQPIQEESLLAGHWSLRMSGMRSPRSQA